MAEVLFCVHCHEQVRWALGLRWMPSQKRYEDISHLIRADNGLYAGRCLSSPDPDLLHATELPATSPEGLAGKPANPVRSTRTSTPHPAKRDSSMTGPHSITVNRSRVLIGGQPLPDAEVLRSRITPTPEPETYECHYLDEQGEECGNDGVIFRVTGYLPRTGLAVDDVCPIHLAAVMGDTIEGAVEPTWTITLKQDVR